jgi:hypothetical protein
MDWVMIVLILTSAPNFAQSQSHELAGFSTEQLCEDASMKLRDGLGGPFGGVKIEVRTVCAQRKPKFPSDPLTK